MFYEFIVSEGIEKYISFTMFYWFCKFIYLSAEYNLVRRTYFDNIFKRIRIVRKKICRNQHIK